MSEKDIKELTKEALQYNRKRGLTSRYCGLIGHGSGIADPLLCPKISTDDKVDRYYDFKVIYDFLQKRGYKMSPVFLGKIVRLIFSNSEVFRRQLNENHQSCWKPAWVRREYGPAA